MAKIPLRAYNREIESLIEKGQVDEAIAHCKYILKFFPKHIDTYRLLGKAYLEAQKYTEAIDILQRILSVIPDDFVSQIGMSMIREDEGSMDAAIHHMERAFEIQPSNPAVQDELRRLYGRRDGVEPPKIRLTRGALIRMYARGELTRQAIAEIRAALSENSDRIDLEIILARMYYFSGQTVEAIEVCSRLVNKLPFCYEINCILAEVLPNTSRAEDAKVFKQRISALDPYSDYISPSTPTSAQVPDQAVTVEKLEYTPSAQEAQQPDWARNMGVEIQPETSEIPEWLVPPEPGQAALAPQEPLSHEDFFQFEEQPQQPLSEQGEPEIPDWMQSAGWLESTPERQQQIEETLTPPEAAATGEGPALAAEIPDWLQSLAPKGETEQFVPPIAQPPSAAEASELPDWMQSLSGAQETKAPSAAEEFQFEETPAAPSLEEQPVQGEIEANEPDQMPDWLKDLQPAQPTTPPVVTAPLDEEKLPDWLKTLEEEPRGEKTGAEQTAAGLPEVTPEAAEKTSAGPTSQVEVPSGQDIDAAMSWLESLAARQGAEQETLITSPEQRLSAPPDWIQKEMKTEPETAASEAVEEIPTVETITQETVRPVEPVSEIHAEEAEELPDWLKEITPIETQEKASEPAAEIPPLPEWLSVEESGEVPAEEEPLPAESITEQAAQFSWQPEITPEIVSQVEEELPAQIEMPSASEEVISSIEMEGIPAVEEISQPEELAVVEEVPQPEEIAVSEEAPQPEEMAVFEEVAQPEVIAVVEEAPQSEEIAVVEEVVQPEEMAVVEEVAQPEEITVAEEVPQPVAAIEETAVQVPETPAAAGFDMMAQAQTYLNKGNIEKSVEIYNQLISKGENMDQCIQSLRDALYRYPVEITLWQALGDACMHEDRIQEALDAYTKAEELLQ